MRTTTSLSFAAVLVGMLLIGCGGGQGMGDSAGSTSIDRGSTSSPTPAPTSSPNLPTIINSGSTNTLPWRATVSSSGQVTYVNGTQSGTGTISATLAAQFYQDLNAALPLSSIPTEFCMKSASFGTTTVITWQGQRSPDISCPGNAAAVALDKDAGAIAAALHLGGPRFPLQAGNL